MPDRAADIRTLLTSQLPEHDRALVGWPAILGHLGRLHVHRPNGLPLTRRQVGRWHTQHGLPLVKGSWHRRYRTPTFTTVYALTAWLLKHAASDEVFRLYPPPISSEQSVAKGRDCTSDAAARAA